MLYIENMLIPKNLIIDAASFIDEFECTTQRLKHSEADIDEVIDGIFVYSHNDSHEEHGLNNYISEVKSWYAREDMGDDGSIFSNAVETLGRKLLTEIRQIGGFSINDVLPYELKGITQDKCLVLERVKL